MTSEEELEELWALDPNVPPAFRLRELDIQELREGTLRMVSDFATMTSRYSVVVRLTNGAEFTATARVSDELSANRSHVLQKLEESARLGAQARFTKWGIPKS